MGHTYSVLNDEVFNFNGSMFRPGSGRSRFYIFRRFLLKLGKPTETKDARGKLVYDLQNDWRKLTLSSVQLPPYFAPAGRNA